MTSSCAISFRWLVTVSPTISNLDLDSWLLTLSLACGMQALPFPANIQNSQYYPNGPWYSSRKFGDPWALSVMTAYGRHRVTKPFQRTIERQSMSGAMGGLLFPLVDSLKFKIFQRVKWNMLVQDGKGCGWIDRHILLVIRLMVLFVPTSEFHIVCCILPFLVALRWDTAASALIGWSTARAVLPFAARGGGWQMSNLRAHQSSFGLVSFLPGIESR